MSTFPCFSDFHQAVRVQRPYRWQIRLAETLADGSIPKVIDVPTGLGKSTTLLAAVWALAHQVHRGGPRSMPQRILHVVDRRRVVDEAHDPIATLAIRLAEASPGSPLVPVADALRALSGPWDEPLAAERIHGEIGDSRDWLRPTGCSVVGMTPHQLVSRLLFRGFGVGERLRSLHAGLIGVDALIILDEPHLSAQAIATISAALAWQDRASSHTGLPASRLVLLGATVPDHIVLDTDLAPVSGQEVFALNDADLTDSQVARRLNAPKPLRLVNVEASHLDKELAAQAWELQTQGMGSVVVMVNTVETARKVHALLGKADASWLVVTSRMRGTDRRLMNLKGARYVVATQCLEVGVDVSFEALVTEPCPYPVLVQRLGRLDRLLTGRPPQAVLVAPVDGTGEDVVRTGTAKVYGETSVSTTQRFVRDLASSAYEVPMDLATQLARRDNVPLSCWPDPPRLATLHEGYTETLATTYPTPAEDLPWNAFIAGPGQAQTLDVLVAWRDDLAAVSAGCSPLPPEFVAIPLPALSRFLAGRGTSSVVADVPVANEQAESGPVPYGSVMVRREREWIPLRSTGDLGPGDTVVLSRLLGGYDGRVGWAPDSREPVSDHALVAADQVRNRRGYRATAVAPLSVATLDPYLAQLPQVGRNATDLGEWIDGLRLRLADGATTPDSIAAELAERGLPVEWQVQLADERHLVVWWPNEPEIAARPRAALMRLEEHVAQVAEFTRRAGTAAGITPDALRAVTAAAFGHDEGKRKDSFQLYLGNVDLTNPIAKSPRGKVGRTADQRYARRAGHPVGWRHEGLSAARTRARGADILVEHLIGAHHGRYRPFLGSAVGQEESQSESPRRAGNFAQLNREWGPWGLAYLEALLRLSDWQASALPSIKMSAPPVRDSKRTAPSVSGVEAPLGASVCLRGLVSSPMTGWYAVAGLLWATEKVAPGVVWWDRSVDDLGAPRWQSTATLAEAVWAAISSPQWGHLDRYGRDLGSSKGFGVKYQKVHPPHAVRRLLRASAAEGATLPAAITQDAVPLDGDRLPLALPAFNNNSSYPEQALLALQEARRDTDKIVATLLDPLEGWRQAQCDGGMDRPPADGGIRGVEPDEGRQTRQLLAPLALLGMAAFGVGGIAGAGVVAHEECHLPCPGEPTDLATLGALLRCGPSRWPGRGVQWQSYRRARQGKESIWVPLG